MGLKTPEKNVSRAVQLPGSIMKPRMAVMMAMVTQEKKLSTTPIAMWAAFLSCILFQVR